MFRKISEKVIRVQFSKNFSIKIKNVNPKEMLELRKLLTFKGSAPSAYYF